MSDNKDQNLPEDDNYEFDPNEMSDAGESEEAKQAEAQAKQTTINLNHRRADTDALRMEAYTEQNIISRAKKLSSLGVIKFMHFKPAPGEAGKMGLTIAKAESELNRLAVFDALFDYGSGVVPFPHKDTFKGRLVDHTGEVLTQKNSQQVDLIMAVNAAGLDNPAARAVGESFMIWASQHKRDGLLWKFEQNMKPWDQKSRLETYLIEMFKPFDTPLTRLVSKYFWLSLYNRITNPGCPAPTSIAFIGSQGAGKSLFSRKLCETLMDDPNSAPIPLDWSVKDFNKFLRGITGHSIIANVAEMGGLKKADIERMKDFATRDKDELDFKFEDSLIKPRQWIIITDGNTYEGLQRDETGNRRFYPFFVAQKPDVDGQPAWEEGFEVDYTGFRAAAWQLMAECREWMQTHGKDGYINLVREVQRGVQDFSRNEMKHDRGTLKDFGIESYLGEILCLANYTTTPSRGYFIPYGAIMQGFDRKQRIPPNARGLKAALERYGYEKGQHGAYKGYFLPFSMMDGKPERNLETLLADRFIVPGNGPDEFAERVKQVKEIRRESDDTIDNYDDVNKAF